MESIAEELHWEKIKEKAGDKSILISTSGPQEKKAAYFRINFVCLFVFSICA